MNRITCYLFPNDIGQNFDTNSKNRLIGGSGRERAVRNCSHQTRIRRIRFHWKGGCQNSSSICSDCIPFDVFSPSLVSIIAFLKLLTSQLLRFNLMWMEEFSGLRDYGENSITVKELTDFESRIIYILSLNFLRMNYFRDE